MKKIFVVFIIALLVFSIGCSSKKSSSSPSATIVVSAIVGTTAQSVVITTSSGPVTDATVKINGSILPLVSAGTGGYGATFLFGSGVSISLSITSPEGNASASGTIPFSAGQTSVPVSGAMNGSTMTLSNP